MFNWLKSLFKKEVVEYKFRNLTSEDVETIHRLLANGAKQKDVAEIYNVSKSTIRRVNKVRLK